jgi:putative transposase
VLDALHAPRFAQIWARSGPCTGCCGPTLSSGERRRQASHPPRTVPLLVAGRPSEEWSYDATALRGAARAVSYDLVVMLDILSRYCPGWLVADQESALVVKAWIEQMVAA